MSMRHSRQTERRGRGGGAWLQVTATLVLVAGAGGGLYAFVQSLDPGTIKLIAGFLLALSTIVVVGGLYAGKDVLQTYLVRRHERQDELRDTQALAQWTRLMQRNSRPNTPGASIQMIPPTFDGDYRETTFVDNAVEIE